jgi:hypothetical protein
MVPRKLEVEKTGKLKLEGAFVRLNQKGETIFIETFRVIS